MNKNFSSHQNNIILIGIPGCGKSTVGVVLAKKIGFGFIDTDLLIQQSQRQRLQDIVNEQGFQKLREYEEKVLCSLAAIQQIIATGGSAVYSEKGMKNLKSLGKIVYLRVDLKELERRVGDFSERGIASENGSSFKDIYEERCPLYEKYADIVIDCEKLNVEQVAEAILS